MTLKTMLKGVGIFAVAIMIFSTLVGSAQADSVDIQCLLGVVGGPTEVRNESNNPLPLGNKIQIFKVTGSIDGVDPTNAVNHYTAVGGDDVWIGDYAVGEGGTDTAGTFYINANVLGQIYVRAWNNANPALATHYGTSALSAVYSNPPLFDTWNVPTFATVTPKPVANAAPNDPTNLRQSVANNAWVSGGNITFTISMSDPNNLDTLTPQVAYSTNGGSTWSAWVSGTAVPYAGVAVDGTVTIAAATIGNAASVTWKAQVKDAANAFNVNPPTSANTFKIDTTAPTVASTTPTGTGIAKTTTQATITFTENNAMDTTSAQTTTNYTIVGASSGAHTISSAVYNAANKTVTLTFAGAFTDSETVTGTVTTNIKDAAGNALSSYSWNFTIAAPASVVNLTNPANNITLKGGQAFSITWTNSGGAPDHYNLAYSTDGGATYPNVISDAVAGNVTSYSWTVPSINSTQVRVRLQAHDVNHAALSTSANVSNFTIDSTAPTMIFNPASGAINVATSQNVVITFSETMNLGSLTYNTTLPNPSVSWNSPTNTIATISHSALNTLTTYTFTVTAATDPAGNSVTGLPSTTSFTTAALAVPVATAATNNTQTSFDANWTASTGATGYLLDVSTDSGFTAFVTGFNNKNVGNVQVASVTGLTPNTPYYYRVRATSASGTSASSSTINTTTLPNAPAAPTGLNAGSITTTNAALSWIPLAGPVTAYTVSYGTDTNATNGGTITVTNGTSTPVSGLTPNTTYNWKVRATNSGGDGPYSSIPSFTTLPNLPNVPATPTGLTHSAITISSAVASWDAVAGATSYTLSYGTDANASNSGTIQNIAGLTTTLSGLTANTAYNWKVLATNAGGDSAYSATDSFTTLPISELPVITSISPAAAPAGIKITVSGEKFGDSQGASTLVFSNTKTRASYPADIVSWSNGLIEAIVPPTAVAGTYEVNVNRISIAQGGLTALQSAPKGFKVTSAGAGETATIYPNPFKAGSETLTIAIANSGGAANVGYYLYDMTARLVWRQVVSTNQTTWSGLDLNGLVVGDGAYLLRVINEDTKTLLAKGKVLVVKR